MTQHLDLLLCKVTLLEQQNKTGVLERVQDCLNVLDVRLQVQKEDGDFIEINNAAFVSELREQVVEYTLEGGRSVD